ncbi:hypothetical protein Fcan01_16538 [Folsomia candida]|uniref:Uncharacterized protein n=1 Tax=Folsomia candida TaxID=158441 RepID=A0A226DUA9_FOLCA|nr:hypothetical protein Fcan01_16538 [Folsomia candida]
MFSVIFYAQLKRHLKLSSYWAALPFLFNSRTGMVTMMSSRWAILLHKVELASTLIYTILQCVMTLTSSYPETNKYIAMVFISVYGTGLGLRFSWKMDPVPMEFMNSLMQYERKLLDGIQYKKTLPDKIMTFILPLVLFTGTLLPFACVLVLAKFPCAPPFLGSMLTYCRDVAAEGDYQIPVFARVGILIAEFFMFCHVCIAAAFYITHVLFPGLICVWDYIRIVDSWEIYTISEISKCIQAYRELRIIEILNNLTNRTRVLPACAIGFPAIQFFSFYVCIRLHENIPPAAFIMFPTAYFDCFLFTIVIFTAAARVYTGSESLLKKWERRFPNVQRKSVMRKTFISFPPLKVRMGGNFVEAFTPLVVQDFCVRTTASMLMLSQ